MGAPRGGSCNSNSCMKLSFEGRESQSAIRSRSQKCEWVPERPQAAHSHLRVAQCGWTVRRKTSSPNKIAKTSWQRRGASHGFRSVAEAEGMARPRAVVNDTAWESAGARL